jgi:hypothetical protein
VNLKKMKNFKNALMRIRIREPGFSAFLTPGSEIQIRDGKESGSGNNIPAHISQSLLKMFGVQTLKFLVADPDPGRSGIPIPDQQHWKMGGWVVIL